MAALLPFSTKNSSRAPHATYQQRKTPLAQKLLLGFAAALLAVGNPLLYTARPTTAASSKEAPHPLPLQSKGAHRARKSKIRLYGPSILLATLLLAAAGTATYYLWLREDDTLPNNNSKSDPSLKQFHGPTSSYFTAAEWHNQNEPAIIKEKQQQKDNGAPDPKEVGDKDKEPPKHYPIVRYFKEGKGLTLETEDGKEVIIHPYEKGKNDLRQDVILYPGGWKPWNFKTFGRKQGEEEITHIRLTGTKTGVLPYAIEGALKLKWKASNKGPQKLPWLIISEGVDRMLGVSIKTKGYLDDLLKTKNRISGYIIADSYKAVEAYNGLLREGENPILLLHTTC